MLQYNHLIYNHYNCIIVSFVAIHDVKLKMSNAKKNNSQNFSAGIWCDEDTFGEDIVGCRKFKWRITCYLPIPKIWGNYNLLKVK